MEGNRKVRKPGPCWLRKQAATGPPGVAMRLWSSKASGQLPRKPQGEIWPCLFCICCFKEHMLLLKSKSRCEDRGQSARARTIHTSRIGLWILAQNSCTELLYISYLPFLKMRLIYGGRWRWRTTCRSWFLLPLGESQRLNKVVRLGGRHLICWVISLGQEVPYKKMEVW